MKRPLLIITPKGLRDLARRPLSDTGPLTA
jgi:hypothetical protein